MDVDIIAFDLSRRLPFRLKPALLQAAVKRGLHLEICYAAALREEGSRRSCFANALGKKGVPADCPFQKSIMCRTSALPKAYSRQHVCGASHVPALRWSVPTAMLHNMLVGLEDR